MPLIAQYLLYSSLRAARQPSKIAAKPVNGYSENLSSHSGVERIEQKDKRLLALNGYVGISIFGASDAAQKQQWNL
jgi:hypothetical protein